MHHLFRLSALFCLAVLLGRVAFADGLRDNDPTTVRPVPRPGIEVPDEDRQQLKAGLSELNSLIAQLKGKKDPLAVELLPDVEIYHRAVSDALTYNEFFAPGDIAAAKELLVTGTERATQLLKGNAPWTTKTGLVVRGYRSRIDHSAQPYGLVIPENYGFPDGESRRLDLWFHGRGETLSEVNFINQRSKRVGNISPADTIVLHPYGRYSNAFKFAGEIDVLEALDHARQHYRVDDDRIAARGFSMGGAAAWQFAVHYPDRWFAANPGAGFSETPEFLKFFQKETLNPTDYERLLWHYYDCTDNAVNLYQCPTIAYSGELDIQKQAADIMETALKAENIDLVHIIGPQTKHRIHPDSLREIETRLAALAARGRERIPREIHFVTYTLKFNKTNWVTIDGLGEHWQQARVDAKILGDKALQVKTKNVTDISFHMPSGWCPFDIRRPVEIEIDDQLIDAPSPRSDRSWDCSLYRQEDGTWKLGTRVTAGLHKKHDLQGPIDDAFLDSFIFVTPTGQGSHPDVNKWVQQEFDHAVKHWRLQFRGHARVKKDTAISDDDIANSNLVLWGDPKSNAVLAKIADKLPIRWDENSVTVGDQTYPAGSHVPVLIFPNPLNPEKYIVLNSGFTYREYDYLNNARQVPKLPDWAIIDIRTPANSQYPGKVVEADFFDESWRLKPVK
ncbi:Prolyl oligopeptidase family protein [Symmachiella dynata]|uniref:prolyl oligopeptidase family serine peptidase n=1 Tax=Symmachiella dynata TaxID=2527995 RepID=UPI00118BCC6A|nr:prolyl oligopeptidase family serine peptidase [Symmachiella dynata]QDT49548.1 Prolyl oligopeptidase family protein [Symmachiella dynata]